ncbi:MAG: hypothetical protein ABFR82_00810 [Nitrospirota bacterium]
MRLYGFSVQQIEKFRFLAKHNLFDLQGSNKPETILLFAKKISCSICSALQEILSLCGY